jgi:hypothetical protein
MGDFSLVVFLEIFRNKPLCYHLQNQYKISGYVAKGLFLAADFCDNKMTCKYLKNLF